MVYDTSSLVAGRKNLSLISCPPSLCFFLCRRFLVCTTLVCSCLSMLFHSTEKTVVPCHFTEKNERKKGNPANQTPLNLLTHCKPGCSETDLEFTGRGWSFISKECIVCKMSKFYSLGQLQFLTVSSFYIHPVKGLPSSPANGDLLARGIFPSFTSSK